MTEEEQIDIIIDILTDFDEMGFAPTTTVPDPETYAIKWRKKLTDALNDYRNRQKAEIEELREIVFMDRSEAIKQLKAEAVKEFAEKLKRCMDSYADDWCWIEMSQISFEEMVDLLVKEFRRKKKND
jgi:hypothetical protein